MKTVVNSREVAHLWFHGAQAHARNSCNSIYFEGATIYSWGSHFPIARKVERNGQTVVLFTSRGYSNSTSKHKNHTRVAIPSGTRVFYVNAPSDKPEREIEHARERIADLSKLIGATNHKKRQANLAGEMQSVVTAANELAAFFGIRTRLKVPAELAQVIAYGKALAKKEHAANVAREKAAAKKEAELQAKILSEGLPLWLDGECTGESVQSVHRLPFAYFRVSQDGEVESTKGACFPLDHAKRAFSFIVELRAKGGTYHHNGHSVHVGHYRIDSIDAAGNVHAGCHSIEWSEVERFARAQAWMA